MSTLLPPLREDLQLKQTEIDALGRLSWVIHDPARNRFFSLDWLSSELLKRWQLRDSERVLHSVNSETTLDADQQDIEDLTSFLQRNELLQAFTPESTDRLYQRSVRGKSGLLSRLLKHYLYYRVPLINPEPILQALSPLVAPLGTVFFARLTLIALFVGLYQLSRRWDSFTHSFSQLLSLESLFQVGLILVCVKVLHEFGHAFTAAKFGCRVPRMGVIFLVMFPVAYTDVTDSWKLTPSQRKQIALSGIRVELMIAAWVTLLWGLLPPGGIRDGLFMILTVTWIGTLIINASPFMRFDGYFVLMDHWRLPNLHQRAGALGRWWLRRILLGVPDPAPEYLGAQQRPLIVFAYLSWIYRLVVLLGIAWLVYTVIPQPFGLFLAAVELLWFILLPVARELVQWPSLMLGSIRRVQFWFFVSLLIFLGLTLFYPWRDSFTVKAVLMPQKEWLIEIEESAQLRGAPPVEGPVEQNALIAGLSNPDLDYRLAQLRLQRQRTEWMLNQTSFVGELLASGSSLQAKLMELKEEERELMERIESLDLRALRPGYFVPSDLNVRSNDWLAQGTELGRLYATEQVVTGYLDASQRYWLDLNSTAKWTSEFSSAELLLDAIGLSDQASKQVDHRLLLSSAGGGVSARKMSDAWVPQDEIYQFTASVPETKAYGYSQLLGEVEFGARPHSPWMLFANRVKQQIQQDFGFIF